MTRRRIIGLLGVMVAILVVGLATLYWWAFTNRLPARAKGILEQAESYELRSLYQRDDRKTEEGRYFGWRVLGKTTLVSPETRKQIRTSLYQGVAAKSGDGYKCFWPRHAIHAEHNGHSVDILICFECDWIWVYFDGQVAPEESVGTTANGQSVFDAILREAGVPLNEPDA